jgi:hypothetical protein
MTLLACPGYSLLGFLLVLAIDYRTGKENAISLTNAAEKDFMRGTSRQDRRVPQSRLTTYGWPFGVNTIEGEHVILLRQHIGANSPPASLRIYCWIQEQETP